MSAAHASTTKMSAAHDATTTKALPCLCGIGKNGRR
jgi:hypothetical protein